MSLRLLTYALLSGSIAVSACDRSPASPAEPGGLVSSPVTLEAEPLTLKPEFIDTKLCAIRPAFRVRLSVILRSGGTVVLNGLRFQFIDRFGQRILPEVTAIPNPSFGSTLPSSSTVPIPGIAALPSGSVSGALPFIATFSCDVVPDGILVILGDVQEGGTQRTAEMRLRVSN